MNDETNDETAVTEDKPQPLWIQHYRLENIRAVELEEMDPAKVQVFEGGEGTGKTSRIEGIIAALTPGEHRPALVREGAPEGTVILQLTDGTEVERTYTPDGGAPRAKVHRGKFQPTAVQKFLDEFFGLHTFDPIAFMELAGKEQTQELMEYIPVELSDEKINELADYWGWTDDPVTDLIDRNGHPLAILRQMAEALYEKRLDIGRLKTMHQETSYGVFHDDLPEGFDAEAAEAASSEVLSAELAKVRTHNTKVISAKQNVEVTQEKRKRISADLESSSEQLVQLSEACDLRLENMRKRHEAEIENVLNDHKHQQEARQLGIALNQSDLDELAEREEAATAWLAENEPLPVEDLQQQLSDHDKVKELLGVWRSGQEHQEKATAYEVVYQHLTSLLAGVRLMPGVLLSKVDIPIEGLAFNSEEGWFEIHERPLDALSDGERLRLALDVARMTAGPLRVLFIDKAEQLDPDRWAQLLEVALADEFQYFISKVGEGELRVECYNGQEE